MTFNNTTWTNNTITPVTTWGRGRVLACSADYTACSSLITACGLILSENDGTFTYNTNTWTEV